MGWGQRISSWPQPTGVNKRESPGESEGPEVEPVNRYPATLTTAVSTSWSRANGTSASQHSRCS